VGIFSNLGAPELLIILVIILLIFGASRLPDIARSLGKSSSEFKKGIKEGSKDVPEDASEEQKPSITPD
jgi:sec-independent protein translocase protein TatA